MDYDKLINEFVAKFKSSLEATLAPSIEDVLNKASTSKTKVSSSKINSKFRSTQKTQAKKEESDDGDDL